MSEEIQLRDSSPNDIRLARILLQYHAEQFRIILKDHDFHGTIESRYVTEIGAFLNQLHSQHLAFQKNVLKPAFDRFIGSLELFRSKVAKFTGPYLFGGQSRTSVRDPRYVNDLEIADHHKKEIDELNSLGFIAWGHLDGLVAKINKFVPEALDTPLEVVWVSPNYDR